MGGFGGVVLGGWCGGLVESAGAAGAIVVGCCDECVAGRAFVGGFDDGGGGDGSFAGVFDGASDVVLLELVGGFVGGHCWAAAWGGGHGGVDDVDLLAGGCAGCVGRLDAGVSGGAGVDGGPGGGLGGDFDAVLV